MALFAVIELSVLFRLELAKKVKVMVTVQAGLTQPDIANEAWLFGIL